MKRLLVLPLFLALLGCPKGPVKPTGLEGSQAAPQTVKQLEQENARLKQALRVNEQQLADARLAEHRAKLNWVVGIAGVAALAFTVLAIFLPTFKRWAVMGVIASIVVAALAMALSWLLPYLLWIGLGVLAVIVGVAIWYWRQDARSRDQIVAAVNTYKDTLQEHAPGWKEHFKKYIDAGSDRVINKARARLRLDPAPEK